MLCAAAERPTECAVAAAQDGLAAAARVAAMDVPINVRRFMGGILLYLRGKETGDWRKRRAARPAPDRPPRVVGIRSRTANRIACGADRAPRSSAGSWSVQ